MRYKVYGKWMGISWQDEQPIQPKRENRSFLRYEAKPKIILIEPYVSRDFSFSLESMKLVDICPRTTIQNINFTALQVWLDHLGKAIYNPIYATLLPDGQYVLAIHNGD